MRCLEAKVVEAGYGSWVLIGVDGLATVADGDTTDCWMRSIEAFEQDVERANLIVGQKSSEEILDYVETSGDDESREEIADCLANVKSVIGHNRREVISDGRLVDYEALSKEAAAVLWRFIKYEWQGDCLLTSDYPNVMEYHVFKEYDNKSGSNENLSEWLMAKPTPFTNLETFLEHHKNKISPTLAAHLCAQVLRGIRSVESMGFKFIQSGLKNCMVYLKHGRDVRLADGGDSSFNGRRPFFRGYREYGHPWNQGILAETLRTEIADWAEKLRQTDLQCLSSTWSAGILQSLPSEDRQSSTGTLYAGSLQSLPSEDRQSPTGTLYSESLQSRTGTPDAEDLRSLLGTLDAEELRSLFGTSDAEYVLSLIGTLDAEDVRSLFGTLDAEDLQSRGTPDEENRQSRSATPGADSFQSRSVRSKEDTTQFLSRTLDEASRQSRPGIPEEESVPPLPGTPRSDWKLEVKLQNFLYKEAPSAYLNVDLLSSPPSTADGMVLIKQIVQAASSPADETPAEVKCREFLTKWLAEEHDSYDDLLRSLQSKRRNHMIAYGMRKYH